jgi:hypothetical protein
MSSEGEPDTDQVSERQDDAAEVHERLDIVLEKDVVDRVGLMVVASLTGGLVRGESKG